MALLLIVRTGRHQFRVGRNSGSRRRAFDSLKLDARNRVPNAKRLLPSCSGHEEFAIGGKAAVVRAVRSSIAVLRSPGRFKDAFCARGPFQQNDFAGRKVQSKYLAIDREIQIAARILFVPRQFLDLLSRDCVPKHQDLLLSVSNHEDTAVRSKRVVESESLTLKLDGSKCKHGLLRAASFDHVSLMTGNQRC